MEKEREQQVYLARLAEQAERYDGKLSPSRSRSFVFATADFCFQVEIFPCFQIGLLCYFIAILAYAFSGQFPI